MEFKENYILEAYCRCTCINRIRLEFKGMPPVALCFSAVVLIESDWNLKELTDKQRLFCIYVLIESDWNLKNTYWLDGCLYLVVLIESDWNLKMRRQYIRTADARINRIRLEFKVASMSTPSSLHLSVLIESDWNLKSTSNTADFENSWY